MCKAMPRGYMVVVYAPGHAPGLCPAAEPSRARSRGEGQLGCKIYSHCAGLAHCQAAPGPAHRLRGACARRDASRRLSGGACVPQLLGACAAAPACLLESVIFAPRLGACARRALAPEPSCLNCCLIPV